MDTALLRSFVTLAKLGHLGRAAGELSLTKPTISYHLKELESMVNQTLFTRSASGMSITAAGDHFLPMAQRALDAVNEFESSAQQRRNRLTGHAELGLIGDAIWLRAPQVMGILHRHHPDLAVHLRQTAGGAVQRDVLEGRLSAGWILGSVDEPGLAARTLASVRMRVVGPRSWARQMDTASLTELADFPWVDGLDQGGLTTHRQALFAQSLRSPASRFHADTERAVYGIVAEGLAVSLLREELALTGQAAGDLAIWPGQVPDLHLRFVIPAIRREEPIGRALFEAVSRSWEPAKARKRPGE